mmetsp:Transcript_4678/g.8962  ORF Transcript_4678/g.8962 Transcript_4678/m.8962 type:complete len:607 (+) Transcript_4678:206-2026(+)|eukprot:CAMPEP_0176485790 /NCGR_PEP_ID=MMETSP0200_2-20121128/5226_1 /TAXON_ID=947934 /ORGANISM="Chaetoceros sp., Strain GSL56" /LENGTH=606 /DNA_ID=CAMNT_0017882455 /DNA_START=99 /DNA_END=1919 /DNA_ORIENTATION=-
MPKTKRTKSKRSPRKPLKAEKITNVKKSKKAEETADEAQQRDTEIASIEDEPSTTGSQKDSKTNRLSQTVLDERAAKAVAHWDNCFADLKAFKEKYGHCLVPKTFKENQSLAYWVQRNRRHYNLYNNGEDSLLTADRIKRLENIGFLFRAKGADAQSALEKKNKREKGELKWLMHFEEICKYKEVHGNCLVPKLYKPNRALASWVYNQRYQYKKKFEGKDVPLNDKRIQKLESIGFCWKAKLDGEWKDHDRDRRRESSQGSWESKFERLVQFKEKHGHTLVPKQYKSDQSLSSWVFRQRRQYTFLMNGQFSSLSNDRLEKLKEIGFVFRVRPDKTGTETNVDAKESSPGRRSVNENGTDDEEGARKTEGVKTRRTTRNKRNSDNIPVSKSAAPLENENTSSSMKEGGVEQSTSRSIEDDVDAEARPKNGKDHKRSTSGKKQNDKTHSHETDLNMKKKMILSSESEPESSDEDSDSSSSSDDSDSEESTDDDSQSSSGSISSDQYEKSDDEIPVAAVPIATVVKPSTSAQENPEPSSEMDDTHSGNASESKLDTNSQNNPSSTNKDKTPGKTHENSNTKKRGNQHLSKAEHEDQSKRAKSTGKKGKF